MPALCLSNGRDQSQTFFAACDAEALNHCISRELTANITTAFALQYGIRRIHSRYMVPVNRKQTLITNFFRIKHCVEECYISRFGSCRSTFYCTILYYFCVWNTCQESITDLIRVLSFEWFYLKFQACYWDSVEGIRSYTHYNFILKVIYRSIGEKCWRWWHELFSWGFEVRTAMVMKSSIFWDITPCSSLKVNLCFGGTCRLHIQGRRISQ
jgi:hypothetical protein